MSNVNVIVASKNLDRCIDSGWPGCVAVFGVRMLGLQDLDTIALK